MMFAVSQSAIFSHFDFMCLQRYGLHQSQEFINSFIFHFVARFISQVHPPNY
jgi:hypothetical protein